jgi:16S rRNA (adenine1518-N6/adenine1519-N6)-dimethyltransferase|tara:strand:+ start:1947 stop:2738 length:792 start_codon:yes stop_codon:yes gene_type:complete
LRSKKSAVRARRRYAQNFLTDPNIISKIISAVAPQPQDHLVEIGPGRGALTDHLVQSSAELDVIEIDRDLVDLLSDRYRDQSLTIHQGDALSFDFDSLKEKRPLRVVGNLPYNISTPLIFRLLEHAHGIKDMHLMLQREVVNRLVAVPSTRDYGRLGIMAQYYCNIIKCFNVPPTAFRPKPKVFSAVVRLIPHQKLPFEAHNVEVLRRLVTQAFSQRRKILRNALKPLLAVDAITALGIDPELRPENVTLQQFIQLSDLLAPR